MDIVGPGVRLELCLIAASLVESTVEDRDVEVEAGGGVVALQGAVMKGDLPGGAYDAKAWIP